MREPIVYLGITQVPEDPEFMAHALQQAQENDTLPQPRALLELRYHARTIRFRRLVVKGPILLANEAARAAFGRG